MKPKNIDGKWYIEVSTQELGNVLLLDKSGFPIPVEFDHEDDAWKYIERKHKIKEIFDKAVETHGEALRRLADS